MLEYFKQKAVATLQFRTEIWNVSKHTPSLAGLWRILFLMTRDVTKMEVFKDPHLYMPFKNLLELSR